jgi:hypothetical protein
MGVVLAFNRNLVLGWSSSKFQSPMKNIGKFVFNVGVKTYRTSYMLDLGFL